MVVSQTQTFKTPLTVDFSGSTQYMRASKTNNLTNGQLAKFNNRDFAKMLSVPQGKVSRENTIETAFSKASKNLNLKQQQRTAKEKDLLTKAIHSAEQNIKLRQNLLKA